MCAAVLVSVLLLNWFSLPNQPGAVSTLSPRAHQRSTAHGRPVPIVLFRTPSGLQAQSTIDPTPIQPSWRIVHGFLLFQDIPRRQGFWGLTRESTKLTVLNPSDLTRAEIDTLGPVLLEAMPGALRQDDHRLDQAAELLGTGSFAIGATPTWSRSRSLPWGYVHNTFTALLATAAFISVALASGRTYRTSLTHNRRLGGVCIVCGYNLHNSPGDACPECGHRHKLTSASPSASSPPPR